MTTNYTNAFSTPPLSVSPFAFADWFSAQQEAMQFWQSAMRSCFSASLAMMENTNRLVSASLPMMTKAFDLGETAVSGMARTARQAGDAVDHAAKVADPLKDVALTMASGVQEASHNAASAMANTGKNAAKPPFTR